MTKYTPFSLFIRQCLNYPLESPFLPPPEKVSKDFSYANGSLLGTLPGRYPKDQHFIDNEDGTTTDESTGLMWVNDLTSVGCNNGEKLTLAAAITFFEELSFAGHADWHFPSVQELATLLNYAAMSPAMFTDYFFEFGIWGAGQPCIWAKDDCLMGEEYHWYINFDVGVVDWFNDEQNFVLPVRNI
jgi:hypothetical protein